MSWHGRLGARPSSGHGGRRSECSFTAFETTPTEAVMRVDQTTGLDWSWERSRRPLRNPMFPLQLNSSAECHLWKCESTPLCSSLQFKKKRTASEPLQCTTSAVRTAMDYQCAECLWNSLDEEKEMLARGQRHNLEYVGLLRKCTVDASARLQAHCAQILKENEFVQGLNNPSLFVHVN